MKILIVDDIKENLIILEAILEGNHYDVESANNGAEALEKLRTDGFDMIISDILMPVMDGYQLCQECKQNDKLKNIPFVFYTATYTSDEDEKFALSLGANAFIRKPAELDVIIQTLREVYEKAKSDLQPPPEVAPLEPSLFLAEYNKRLITKLNKKVAQLQESGEKLKHTSSVLRAIRDINQLIVREKDKTKLLQGACEILTKVREYRFAWIGLIEEGHKRVLPVAQAGLEEGYLDSVKVTWNDTKTGKGPTGIAIKTKQPSIMKNIPEDPRFEPWREEALKRGYLSSAAIPLVYDEKVYGVLNVYSSQRDGFNDEEAGLLVEVSSDLAFALKAIDTEEGRKRAEDNLGERVKELQCLYGISDIAGTPGVTLDELYQKAVNLLPQSWQYPEITCARIIIDGKEFKTKIFRETKEKQSSDIRVHGVKAGIVEVIYLEERPEIDEGPFLKEERLLINAVAERLGRITERKQAEDALRKQTHDVGERVKELSCLYTISQISERVEINLNEVYQEVANLLPPGWQYPEITCSRITVNEDEFRTENYRDTKWKQCADIRVRGVKTGMVEVGYLEKRPVIDEGPFLKEERALINAVAEHLAGIIQRKRAEDALRENEEHFRSVAETAIDAIISADSRGNIIYWNRAAKTIFGYSADEVMGKPLGSIMPARFREAHQNGVERVVSTGKTKIIGKMVEVFGLRKDGSEFPLELSLAKWEARGEIFFTAIIRDITEHKKVEEALQENEERYRVLFSSGDDAIFVHRLATGGAVGKFIEVNDVACQRLGYSRKELLALSAADITVPENLKGAPAIVAKLLTDKHVLFETVHLTKDGRKIPVEINTRLFKLNGQPTVLSIARNITERKKAEEERKKLEARLLQAQKIEAIGVLSGGIAHDFNNLLTPIIGYSQLILDRLVDDDPLRQDVEEIMKAGKRAASLTRQLLAFSRKQVLQPEVLDLNSIVSDIEKMLRRLIGEDIELATVLVPKLKRVKADPGQLEQVIMNLVINSRDAMPEGGKLTIKTENVTLDEAYCKIIHEARPGEFVFLSVEDTGSGMDKETTEHIFEPFFTTKNMGTGLGLSVVYGIVKQHEGWINVYSEPGQGTSFKIYLPAIHAGPEKETKEKISLEEFKGSGQRILLVEDEKAVREFATRVLGENGYVVFKAATANEAMEIFDREKGKFHLVLSDVVLPGKSGLQLVDQLLSRKPKISVLMCSGYTDQKSHWATIRERRFRFLQKPYTLAALLRAVKEAMEKAK